MHDDLPEQEGPHRGCNPGAVSRPSKQISA